MQATVMKIVLILSTVLCSKHVTDKIGNREECVADEREITLVMTSYFKGPVTMIETTITQL